ncbi:hypothetical protein Tcan_05324 [Toxocara canis]|uniref:ATP-dependent DNA helicase n=1 Tax=Toxocara canis TaxID=6265 RepID=A0A0B2VU94_TOXCA|nr:hypothetical protein Tcan_05324 [Toxocara canis]
MRTGLGEKVFACFLQRHGNDELQDRETDGLYVKVPWSCCPNTEEDIVSWLYDDNTLCCSEALANRALLTVRNDDYNDLNAVALNRLNAEEQPVAYCVTVI